MVRTITMGAREMSEPTSGNPEMLTAEQVIEETKRMVRQCAAPAEGLSIKAQKRQAARYLGLTFNRLEDLWYGEAKPSVEEWLLIQWRARQARERAERRMGVADEIRQKVDRAFPDRDERDRGPLECLACAEGRGNR